MKPRLPKSFWPLLKDVSRSFYLTVRILPGSVRHQIGLAYLLARAADTIADTAIIPLEQRLKTLQTFRERLDVHAVAPLKLRDLALQQGNPSEALLLQRCEELFFLLSQFPSPDREWTQQVLATITSGQELDLNRFAEASSSRIIALKDDAELEDYTFRVAGCVGEFWTKLCCAYLFDVTPAAAGFLCANGIRFGNGLQLVNILRDMPSDLRQGRCYLPKMRLTAAGLSPGDLLRPENHEKMRAVFDVFAAKARDNLVHGWNYTLALPWSALRIRLACAWPILIGLKTLRALQKTNVLDPFKPVKISRREVHRILAVSLVLYPWPNSWRKLAK